MRFLPSAKHYDLVEPDRLRMFHSKHADTVKLAGQQSSACSDCGSRNNEHKHALAGHPAIAVFQEHQLHPPITVRPNLGVIGRIQIQQRARFRQYPTLKRAALDRGNASAVGGFGAIGVEFDGGEMSVGIPRDLKKCRAVADAGINGRIRRRGHQQGADVLGFLYRQGIVTELEATSISHSSSTTCDLSRVCGRWVEFTPPAALPWPRSRKVSTVPWSNLEKDFCWKS